MKRLRDIAVLPTLFTVANLVCGFFAIVVASRIDAPAESVDMTPVVEAMPLREVLRHPTQIDRTVATYNIVISSWLIFLAMLFDALDGGVARLTRQTSDFGGQLDSLCDVVTFGVAPAFLMVKMCTGFTLEYRQVVWIIAAVFSSCAALRLARFNVENDDDDSHLWFDGLPVPAAAAAVAGFALALYNLRLDKSYWIEPQRLDILIQFGLPVLAVALSLLMVSRIPYPHVVSHLFRGKRSFAHVVAMVFAAVPAIVFHGYVVPALASLYALAPPLIFTWRYFRSKQRVGASST